MSVNKYNGEGYHDPTTYEALTKIDREEKKKAYKPLVFICSPLATETKEYYRVFEMINHGTD